MEGKLTGNLKPLGDRVLVEQDKSQESKSKAGIIIPEAIKEKPLTGTVVAIGPGRQLKNGEVQPVNLKVGDRVYYSKYAGVEVELNQKKSILLHEDEIYGVLE